MRTLPLRIPQEELDRAQALVPMLAADRRQGVRGEIKRADVVREAIETGLSLLEGRYSCRMVRAAVGAFLQDLGRNAEKTARFGQYQIEVRGIETGEAGDEVERGQRLLAEGREGIGAWSSGTVNRELFHTIACQITSRSFKGSTPMKVAQELSDDEIQQVAHVLVDEWRQIFSHLLASGETDDLQIEPIVAQIYSVGDGHLEMAQSVLNAISHLDDRFSMLESWIALKNCLKMSSRASIFYQNMVSDFENLPKKDDTRSAVSRR